MIEWLLRRFGYYRIDYGFATGRHWLTVGPAQFICDNSPELLGLWRYLKDSQSDGSAVDG